MLSTLCRMLNEFVIVVTLGAWGELVNDVLATQEESKGASGKEWHTIKAHLKETKNFKNSQNIETPTNMSSLTLTMRTRAAANR